VEADLTVRDSVLINHRAQTEGISVEKLIDRLLETVKPAK
jgi:hypothetical protein